MIGRMRLLVIGSQDDCEFGEIESLVARKLFWIETVCCCSNEIAYELIGSESQEVS